MFGDASRSQQPRRSFLGRLGAAAAMLASGGVVTKAAAAPVTREALAGLPFDDEPPAVSLAQRDEQWLAALHGTRRQVFDSVSVNEGYALYYSNTWSRTMRSAYALSNDDVCPLIVMRHLGIAPAFNDTIWAKYRVGEFFQLNDPQSRAPATRNFFNSAARGDLRTPDAAVSRMVESGAVIVVCDIATNAIAGRTARAAGLSISAQDAYQEWAANLLPGCHLVPSGVLAVHRAQAAGDCTYCFAG